MPQWLIIGLHCAGMMLGGNLAAVIAITALANQAEHQPRPPRGGKRIPIALPSPI